MVATSGCSSGSVLDVVIFVVPVLFQNTDPQQVVDDLLGFLLADVIALGKFGRGQADAALLEAEHKGNFTLGKKPVENPEIHVVLVHGAGKLTRNVVGDHPGELHHHLFLDGIVAVMVLYRIVSFIDMYSRVYLFGHRKPPYADCVDTVFNYTMDNYRKDVVNCCEG